MLVQDVGCSIVQYFINELNLTGWLMLLNKILCPLPKNLQAISNVQFVFMYNKKVHLSLTVGIVWRDWFDTLAYVASCMLCSKHKDIS